MSPGSLIRERRCRDAVFVGDLEFGAGIGAEEQSARLSAGRIGVEHEDLPEVGAGRAQQIEPVGLRFGQRLFVAKDDLLGVVIKFAEGDEAAALPVD